MEITAQTFLNRKRITKVSVSVICTSVVLLAISFLTSNHNTTIFGATLGGDWPAFYDAGVIVGSGNAHRLYDQKLHWELYHRLLPDEPPEANLPYANAPFVAIAMVPLALLSYQASFLAWAGISIFMFTAALWLAWRAADLPRTHLAFCLLAGLSFEPLIIENIHGGQISCVGLLALAAAAYLHIHGRALWAGAALAICTYKPTLLPLVLLMLLCTRQWRVLVGVFLGSIFLTGLSIFAIGFDPTFAYFRTLLSYAGQSTASANDSVFRTWKFIDLNSFLKLLGAPKFSILLALAAGYVAFVRAGVRVGLRNSTERPDDLRLAWAAAMSCTLVLNIYVGIYDSVLILPSLLLTAGVILRQHAGFPSSFRLLAACIYVLAWCSQILARDTGYQPLSLALLTLAVLQYQLLNGAPQPDHPEVSALLPTAIAG